MPRPRATAPPITRHRCDQSRHAPCARRSMRRIPAQFKGRVQTEVRTGRIGPFERSRASQTSCGLWQVSPWNRRADWSRFWTVDHNLASAFAYILRGIVNHDSSPEADVHQYFRVAMAAVRDMILSLENAGWVFRPREQPESIAIRLKRDDLPELNGPGLRSAHPRGSCSTPGRVDPPRADRE
jgi:hypothetical protein